MSWNNVIRIRRERLGKSMYRMAKDLEVDPKTYRSWERGEHLPHGYNQEMLIKALGLQKEVFEDD